MSSHTYCPNCKDLLDKMESNGVENKFILADLVPVNESGYRPVKDGLVVELFGCNNCGFVFPRMLAE